MKKAFILIFCLIALLPGCMNYLDDPFPDPQSDSEELVFGLNTFGQEIYKELKEKSDTGDNLVISPYSISNCLAMVYAGARSNTEQQMADVLHYTLSQEDLHPAFGGLNAGLVSANNVESTTEYELTLKIANSGWLQENYSFLSSYVDTLETDHDADVTYIDFMSDYEEARDMINQWAGNATEEKIPELIPAGAIDTTTRLVLVNAIYFKGSWEEPFDESLTEDRSFYLLDGTKIEVPTMQGEGEFQYLEGTGFQAVSLPFIRQGSLAMVILLPKKGWFERVEQVVTAGGMYSVIHNMKSREVILKIPKFYARTNRDLIDDLKAMGMTDAFSAAADLSGMDDGLHSLFVSFVIHESVIDVNEKGTEAAAATAAGVKDTGMPWDFFNPGPVEFIADRPFMYAIYDRKTDAVLFLGRVLVPELEQ